MLRRSDDVSTIYLKCGCFLPDNFSIYRGKPVRFANEDSSTFTIQCKGSFGIPSFRLEANGSHVVNFPKTGKFQFTSAANASLKVSCRPPPSEYGPFPV
jgi:plastocyanin